MTAVDLPIGIPPAWLSAAEADPADVVWKLACSDWLEENGHPLAAEALRWIAEKGRWSGGNWGWNCSVDALGLRNRVPYSLYCICCKLCVEPIYIRHKFSRLIIAYQMGTDEERREWWQWQPSA